MLINTNEKANLRLRELEQQEQQQVHEREEEKKNRNFVMLYRDHMPEIRWLTKKSGIATSILMFILEHMDYKNALVCSYKVFMEYFEVSSDTVRRSIRLLQENGFIDILKTGLSNVYVINPDIAWSSWNNQQKYCQFEGKVLVSKAENKDYSYRNQFDRLKILKEQIQKNGEKNGQTDDTTGTASESDGISATTG